MSSPRSDPFDRRNLGDTKNDPLDGGQAIDGSTLSPRERHEELDRGMAALLEALREGGEAASEMTTEHFDLAAAATPELSNFIFAEKGKDKAAAARLAFFEACEEGFLETAKWLALSYRLTGVDEAWKDTFVRCSGKGRQAVLEWLVKIAPQLRGAGEWQQRALTAALLSGRFETFRWLMSAFGLLNLAGQRTLCREALKSGEIYLVCWLVRVYGLEGETLLGEEFEDLEAAVESRNKRMLMWLTTKFGLARDVLLTRCFRQACSRGLQDMVEWLVDVCILISDDFYASPEILPEVFSLGYLRLANWLMRRFPPARDYVLDNFPRFFVYTASSSPDQVAFLVGLARDHQLQRNEIVPLLPLILPEALKWGRAMIDFLASFRLARSDVLKVMSPETIFEALALGSPEGSRTAIARMGLGRAIFEKADRGVAASVLSSTSHATARVLVENMSITQANFGDQGLIFERAILDRLNLWPTSQPTEITESSISAPGEVGPTSPFVSPAGVIDQPSFCGQCEFLCPCVPRPAEPAQQPPESIETKVEKRDFLEKARVEIVEERDLGEEEREKERKAEGIQDKRRLSSLEKEGTDLRTTQQRMRRFRKRDEEVHGPTKAAPSMMAKLSSRIPAIELPLEERVPLEGVPTLGVEPSIGPEASWVAEAEEETEEGSETEAEAEARPSSSRGSEAKESEEERRLRQAKREARELREALAMQNREARIDDEEENSGEWDDKEVDEERELLKQVDEEAPAEFVVGISTGDEPKTTAELSRAAERIEGASEYDVDEREEGDNEMAEDEPVVWSSELYG